MEFINITNLNLINEIKNYKIMKDIYKKIDPAIHKYIPQWIFNNHQYGNVFPYNAQNNQQLFIDIKNNTTYNSFEINNLINTLIKLFNEAKETKVEFNSVKYKVIKSTNDTDLMYILINADNLIINIKINKLLFIKLKKKIYRNEYYS